jgi:hypothetical protein
MTEATYIKMMTAFAAKISTISCRGFGNVNDQTFLREQMVHAIIQIDPSFTQHALEFIKQGTVGGKDIQIPEEASKMIAKYMLGALAIIRRAPRLWTHGFLNFLTTEAATTVLQKMGNNNDIILRFSSMLNSPDGKPIILCQNKIFKGPIKFSRETSEFSFEVDEVKIGPTDGLYDNETDVEQVCVYTKSLKSKSLYAILEKLELYTGITQVKSNLDAVVVEKNFKSPQMMSILTETPVEQLSDPADTGVDIEGNETKVTESLFVLKSRTFRKLSLSSLP